MALDSYFKRSAWIQVHADPLPVHAALDHLPVGLRDPIPDAQVRSGGDRTRLHVADDHRPRFEARHEPERRDPQQVAGEQEREIPDMRRGKQRDRPENRGAGGGRSARG